MPPEASGLSATLHSTSQVCICRLSIYVLISFLPEKDEITGTRTSLLEIKIFRYQLSIIKP